MRLSTNRRSKSKHPSSLHLIGGAVVGSLHTHRRHTGGNATLELTDSPLKLQRGE